MYECVLQYLISPIWKATIYNFLDEHCIIFDDEEENKFEYFNIHKVFDWSFNVCKKFKKMMEDLVDGLMNEVGIGEEKLGEVIEKGLKS